MLQSLGINSFAAQDPEIIAKNKWEILDLGDIEKRVEYAVEQGVIADTEEARLSFEKEGIRAGLDTLADLAERAGMKTAPALLRHSLQDSPQDIYYNRLTEYANQIAESEDIQELVADYKGYNQANPNVSGRSYGGSTTLNSTTDLHLAYNKVEYFIEGVKSGNLWTLNIRVTDTYDFEHISWKSTMSGYSAAVTAINNYAARGQQIGAVVPYDITVMVRVTFTV